MKILVCFLIAVIIVQCFILWKYQRQVRDICRQLSFLLKMTAICLLRAIRDLRTEGTDGDIEPIVAEPQKRAQKVSEKEQMISDTYTNLSHDIRTPLTSLDGYFQLLEKSEDAEEQKHYMEIIQERIHSLKEMLEELFCLPS